MTKQQPWLKNFTQVVGLTQSPIVDMTPTTNPWWIPGPRLADYREHLELGLDYHPCPEPLRCKKCGSEFVSMRKTADGEWKLHTLSGRALHQCSPSPKPQKPNTRKR
jgi:hypothetical protein